MLLYRNSTLRRYQYFSYPDWPGGIYMSPGLSGSRSGGIVAAAWAAMLSLGEQGYLEIAERIFETAATILSGVAAIPELEVFGDPTFIVAFRGRGIDIYHVNDFLISKGWRLNALQLPPGLHFCVTRPNTADGVAEAFLADLRDAVEYAKTPGLGPARSGALYGLGGSPEGNEALDMLFAAALDAHVRRGALRPMAEPWILAVDLGTGGPKTGAVTLSGELIAVAHRAVATTYSDDGGAVQDPHAWWDGIRQGVAEILGSGVAAGDAIGVGVTGQWGSTVPVGTDGEAVGPCLLWSDTRGRALAARRLGGPISVVGYSPGNLVRWLRLTGGAPSPGGADPLGHHLYLSNREPELYSRIETLLEPLDYLGMRFTGRRAATQASMILSWLTDNRPGRTSIGYAPALVRRSGREAAKLPELLPTGSVLGGLQPAVASELGLPHGIPVVAGIPDLHTGYIGSGAIAPYAGHITISTSAWIGCAVPFKRTDIFHQIASVPGVRAGSYSSPTTTRPLVHVCSGCEIRLIPATRPTRLATPGTSA